MALKLDGRKIEILQVEDDDMDAFLTRQYLAKSGIHFNLHDVKDGEEALQFLKKEGAFRGVPKPDLILLDLNLPKVPGVEVLNFLKLVPDMKDIPVIIVTGEDQQEDLIQKYGLHENTLTRKWIRMKDFVSLVKAIEDYYKVQDTYRSNNAD